MELKIHTRNDYSMVFHSLRNKGCCELCCMRYLGEKTSAAYENFDEFAKSKHIKVEDQCSPPSKISKTSPCIACLGLLQKPYCNALIENVLKDLLKVDYDSDSFNVALTLPVSFQLRAHSIYLYVESKFPEFSSIHFPLGLVTVGVKDVWKWIYTPLIGNAISKEYKTNSELIITLTIKYTDEEKECMSLFEMFPDNFSKTKNRKNQGRHDSFSRKSVETSLKTIESERFSKFFSVPPCVPTSEAVYSGIFTQHGSVFIAGRYNKLSRVLPQTPWVINGERKMEGSVEELISFSLKNISKAQDTCFAASGREDVDVRTLGIGRPFYTEIIDPHKIKLTFEDMRALEREINENAVGKIFVRDLQFVDKSELDALKTGEEKKTKDYQALVLVLDHNAREKCSEKLKELSKAFPITLQQATPIRVLHRRPVAVRQRVIHSLEASPLLENKDMFTIRLNTQAGTYIKEFIHGDFGRTKPCLGDLLGNIEVDILALDVQGVNLDWPPRIEDKKV